MEIINIHRAKTHLSKLIEQVGEGQEFIIGRAGKPVAKLVPYDESDAPRRGGQWRDRVIISEDFDQLPDDLTAAFNGERP